MKCSFVSVDGGIGAGKTTLLQLLRTALAGEKDIAIKHEPVDAWRRVGEQGHDLLRLFYKDPKHYGLAMQVYAFFTRIDAFQQEAGMPQRRIVITERCARADHGIFAAIAHENGHLDDVQWAVYNELCEFLKRQFLAIRPKVLIYLRTPPADCLARVAERARSGEEAIAMEYIETLHMRHDAWLLDIDQSNRPDPAYVAERAQQLLPAAPHAPIELQQHKDGTRVLVLDGSQDFRNDERVAAEYIAAVRKILNEV